MQEMIAPAAVLGYTTGGAVLTLVLPLGFFILVMGAFSLIFTRPHTVPGHRDSIAPAQPVPPPAGTEHGLAAAAGLPIAPSGGGPAPLTDRNTPPVVGAARAVEDAVEDAAHAVKDAVTGEHGKDKAGPAEGTASSESTEVSG